MTPLNAAERKLFARRCDAANLRTLTRTLSEDTDPDVRGAIDTALEFAERAVTEAESEVPE